jgi:hypothetical protein
MLGEKEDEILNVLSEMGRHHIRSTRRKMPDPVFSISARSYSIPTQAEPLAELSTHFSM